MQVHTRKLVALLTASIEARFEHAKAEENANQMKFFMGMKTRFAENAAFAASIEKAQKNGVAYATLKEAFAMIANCDKNSKGAYLAQYAAEKVCKMLRASDDSRALDPYSAAIVANAMLLNGSLSAKGALRSLCKRIELDELDSQELLKYCAKVQVTTASTQRSSTREALRALNLATISKGRKDDTIELNENGKAFFAYLIA